VNAILQSASKTKGYACEKQLLLGEGDLRGKFSCIFEKLPFFMKWKGIREEEFVLDKWKI